MIVWDYLVRAGCAIRHAYWAVHHKLVQTPPAWAIHDLTVFLHWMVPALAILHVILGVVNAHQARNPLQRAMTRFLFAKAFFWVVVWVSFHARNTLMYFGLDVAAVVLAAVTGLDLLIRLTDRYIFVRGGNQPPSPL